MAKIESIGLDWVISEVENLTDHIDHIKPSEFNEQFRYLPDSVTPMPGYIRFNVTPYMREIIDCADIESGVREVTIKKGVQITYTTLLESVLLYYMVHVKTLPMMFVTADRDLAKARIENNIIPMLTQSDFMHIIRSSDVGNTRKTGKTENHLQWEGGGYLIPFGAQNANKMRSFSIAVMLKDETDGWPDLVGKDGDPEKLTSDRCSAYWERRKIFRGSTPLLKASSKIEKAYKRGDQRKYKVRCISCGFPQELRWHTVDKKTGLIGGFYWELEEGVLQLDSVCYMCQNCGHKHFEADKERLFSPDFGAEWVPTVKPVEPGLRSYHLPAMYSPIGMQPWYKCVSQYLEGYDPISKKVIDIGVYQTFYNNILAEPFNQPGSKVSFVAVSAHRRGEYSLGQIPNKYAIKYSGSHILFLMCTVDVHRSNLAVSVHGVTREFNTYLIDYWRFEHDTCDEINSPVWGRLREVIEEKEYKADDGKKYRVILTLIDAGFANDVVTTFCADYERGVYPILGRERPGKNQTIKEFSPFTTQIGTVGYKIVVDHYKDRIAPVLRREWFEDMGKQKKHHFNAPVNVTDKQLKELTVEVRKEKIDEYGKISYVWDRPGNARNELWDLVVYCHAGVEILAWSICIQHFELEAINWIQFWDYLENQKLYYLD